MAATLDLERTLNLCEALDREAHPVLHPIRNDEEHTAVLEAFEKLMSRSVEQPDSPEAGLYVLLADRLEAYERRTAPVPATAPHEALRFLMEQHGLRQNDLPELGSQGVVSELLSGKRDINARQARALADRFRVEVGLFV